MTQSGYWRREAAPIVASVIERVGKDDIKALRKALREAYPFGPKSHYPYKAWLAEIRRQTGASLYPRRTRKQDPSRVQLSLFDPQ